jgi:NADH:ubiquinone oxidoreductase subunit E
MNLNELLEQFGKDGYVSPEDLETVAEVVKLLVAKVEELEAQVQALSN